MSFCDDAWQATAETRAAIDRHPFLTGLTDGTLPQPSFNHYLGQDAIYLGIYARVLAGLASQADDIDEGLFWSNSASTSVLVERQLHESRVSLGEATTGPTTLAYTSYLLATLAGGSYPVAVAAVLPCFWIYQDVGDTILARVGDLTGHPYADWIGMYADEAFAESVRRAKEIADHQASRSGDAVVTRMLDAFATAARYEWMFWDAGWRRETWPV